jgi:hypothetical protein
MYQKFAILLLKGSPKQTFWAMELFGKFPKNSPHFKDFLFCNCQEFWRIWAGFLLSLSKSPYLVNRF